MEHIYFLSRKMRIMAPENELKNVLCVQDYLEAIMEHIYFLSHKMRVMAPENELKHVLFSKTIWKP